jgi:sodium-dependent dicarboxylate transporter 2/3/5
MSEYKGIVIALILGLIGYFLSGMYINETQARLVGSIVFLVALWTNEALPLGVVSLLPIVIFPALGIIDTNLTSSNYSKSIIFLFLGGFMIAIATEKTGLHRILADELLAIFPSTPRGIILSLSISAAILSSVLSNTTTALLLIPIASFITSNNTLRVRFLLAIAYGASIGGIITPIGTPPNLILMGFLDSRAIETIGFAKWMGLTIPLALFMLLVLGYILSYKLNNIKLDHTFEKQPSMDGTQKRLFRIIGALVALLIINSPIEPFYSGLGLNEKGILLAFGIIMFLPKIGFLEWEDSKKIPFNIIFLFGAGFSIATAFSKTGLANVIAENLVVLTTLPPMLLIMLLATAVTFSTEVTSNTALTSIALPVIYSLGVNANLDILLILMVVTICASYAFMLPIATPPNAIAMSTGVVSVKEMAKFGFLFNIIGILAITFIATFYWKYFL